jgi:large subunit ribosomal protein L34
LIKRIFYLSKFYGIYRKLIFIKFFFLIFFKKKRKQIILKNLVLMSKHTLNGSRKKAIKTSGFRARIATKSGRKILKNRRRRGRWKLSI